MKMVIKRERGNFGVMRGCELSYCEVDVLGDVRARMSFLFGMLGKVLVLRVSASQYGYA